MTTSMNHHAPAAFQALRQPLDAAGAIFPNEGYPFVSSQQENFIEEIALSHLDTASKLEKVQGLRDHIKLPSGCRDERFFEQEKKETNWVWYLRSRSIGS